MFTKPGEVIALLLASDTSSPEGQGIFRTELSRLVEHRQAHAAAILGETKVTWEERRGPSGNLENAALMTTLIEDTLVRGDAAAWKRLEAGLLAMLGLSTPRAQIQRVRAAVQETIKRINRWPAHRDLMFDVLRDRLGAVDRRFHNLTAGDFRNAFRGAKPETKGGARGANRVSAKLCVSVRALHFNDEKKALKAFLNQKQQSGESSLPPTVEAPRQ
jgi:hypothetical protein